MSKLVGEQELLNAGKQAARDMRLEKTRILRESDLPMELQDLSQLAEDFEHIGYSEEDASRAADNVHRYDHL